MNTQTFKQLQFDEIREQTARYARSDYAKQTLQTIQPATGLETVKTWQQETAEARVILESQQHVPFMGLDRIERLTSQISKGQILMPSELIDYADFLRSSRLIRRFFEKNQFQTPLLYKYTQILPSLDSIEYAIYETIQHQKVADTASRTLKKVRRSIAEKEKEIQEKLRKFLRHPENKTKIQENMVVKKGEHYTVPIKAAYKNQIKGTIIEQSSRGTTVFVEPASAAKLNEEILYLHQEELAEEYQILAELTGRIAEQDTAVKQMIDTITALDLIFARGKYSREIGGHSPNINKEERLVIRNGKHPLLGSDAKPLNLSMGSTYRGIIITGANAGGKTVVLKTAGLFCLMVMFGLQIPAEPDSDIPVFEQIFADIGDQQSMANSLSTFSGHVHNLAGILNKTKRHTLVLLDEIGSGTEPNEGAALAIAVMEELYQKGALIIATTHYGEIKRFAREHEDFSPAAMRFDKEKLQPLYQLLIGETGESQALWIAQKMNIDNRIIKKSQEYLQHKTFSTKRKEFAQQAAVQEKEAVKLLHTGDRVLLTDDQSYGILYRDEGKDQVLVYQNNEMKEVFRKRVQLSVPWEELYPADYDLESLFVSFEERKKARDLKRGSKKARKMLDKEAKKRQN
ncbi:MutS domain V protein [Enterococcus faecalis 13-SD-W-01]|nr:MutS domain V protein [Enterococcus faecalis 13-SD-W-01]